MNIAATLAAVPIGRDLRDFAHIPQLAAAPEDPACGAGPKATKPAGAEGECAGDQVARRDSPALREARDDCADGEPSSAVTQLSISADSSPALDRSDLGCRAPNPNKNTVPVATRSMRKTDSGSSLTTPVCPNSDKCVNAGFHAEEDYEAVRMDVSPNRRGLSTGTSPGYSRVLGQSKIKCPSASFLNGLVCSISNSMNDL